MPPKPSKPAGVTKPTARKPAAAAADADMALGQKQPQRPAGDPLRRFYESLLMQRAESEMAFQWCLEHGHLPDDMQDAADAWFRARGVAALSGKDGKQDIKDLHAQVLRATGKGGMHDVERRLAGLSIAKAGKATKAGNKGRRMDIDGV